MAVAALGCVRSCAVTTTAAGLAMLWPAALSRVMVEADPTGGTLAAAAGLAPEPGLVSLAAAARRRSYPALVLEHCQRLPESTLVLCAPPAPERARPALALASALLARLDELVAATVVDCGRLGTAGPSADLFDQADLSLLVARPRLPDLSALAAFLEGRGPCGPRPGLVLVGPGPYPAAEVAEALGLEVAAHLPWSPEEAEALATTAPSSRHLSRTPLVRALRTLAEDLAGRAAARSPTTRSDIDQLEALAEELA